MNKKALRTLAALALAFSLTACGNANGSDISDKVSDNISDNGGSSVSNVGTSSAAITPEDNENTSGVSESSRDTPHIGGQTVSTDTSYVPPNNDAYGEVSKSVLVLDGGRAMMLYEMNAERGQKYAAAVSEYKKRLGENINVFALIAPTQLSFYLPERHSGLAGDETALINDIYAQMSGIIPIDAFSALKSHVGEDIYYRTDHHWTQLGAYYAARSFAETALVPFDELSDYERHEKENYLGSFYGGSGEHAEIKNNPETFVWYIPKRTVKTIYCDNKFENGEEGGYFLNPDDIDAPSHWLDTYAQAALAVRVDTGLDTGRRLMIIKDSYADMFAPSLFGSFDEIWIADMRFCRTSMVKLAEDNGITDVLFCCSAHTASGEGAYYLEKMM